MRRFRCPFRARFPGLDNPGHRSPSSLSPVRTSATARGTGRKTHQSPEPFGGESYADKNDDYYNFILIPKSPVPFGGESYADGRVSVRAGRDEHVSSAFRR